MRHTSLLLALGLIVGCAPDYTTGLTDSKGDAGGGGDDGADTGDIVEEDTSLYDGATLVILEPEPGAFLPLGEDADFEAIVLDAEGNELDWDDIAWTSNIQSGWDLTGASESDDGLDVGTHSILASATLPNGAVVQDRAGAVLVQHEDAGTYVGNMILDLTGEYQGTPLTASCVGASIVVVDAYGETAEGASDCVISLLGFDQQARLVFDLESDDGDLSGESAIDLSFIQYGFDTDGSIDDGVLEAEWADSVFGFIDVAGSMTLERVTRDTE